MQWWENDVDTLRLLPSGQNVKVNRFVQPQDNNGSIYDFLRVAKCLATLLMAFINGLTIFPIYYLAKLQPREWTWENQQGKKILLS